MFFKHFFTKGSLQIPRVKHIFLTNDREQLCDTTFLKGIIQFEFIMRIEYPIQIVIPNAIHSQNPCIPLVCILVLIWLNTSLCCADFITAKIQKKLTYRSDPADMY